MSDQEHISSGLIEQYLLGLCTPEEKAELEHQRMRDPALDLAIREAEARMEALFLSQSVQPDAATDRKVLATLDALKRESHAAPVKPIRSAVNSWKRVAAVSAALLLLSIAGNVLLLQKNRDQSAQLSRLPYGPPTLPQDDYAVLRNPKITPVAMMGVGNYVKCRCTMFWDKQTGKVFIMIHHLPETDEKEDFQLWAYVNGKPVSVGIINDSIRDRFIEMDGMPAGATEFSVTLGPAKGSASPSAGETYLRGRI